MWNYLQQIIKHLCTFASKYILGNHNNTEDTGGDMLYKTQDIKLYIETHS